MKKTLFTLLAAASCAMGAITLDDALLTSTGADMNLDASGMTDSNVFTLTMELNADAFVKTMATSAPTSTSSWIADMNVTQQDNSEYHLGPAIVYHSSSNKQNASLMSAYAGSDGKIRAVVPTYSYEGGTSSVLSLLTSSAWGYNAETGESSIASAIVTMTGTVGNTHDICITLKKDDGTILEYSATATHTYTITDINSISFNQDIVQEAYFFDKATAMTDVKELHKSMMVPEPATATLSLLALAGLCARRRRK